MTKVDAKADVKQRFVNITSSLGNAKKEGGHIWRFPIIVKLDHYKYRTIGGVKKQRAGRLSYHLGLLENEPQERFDIAREKSYRSWKRPFGMSVQTHK